MGKYSMSVASSTDCPLCPANYYCPNTTTIKACPANTFSAAGKYSLLDCRCEPGFSCSYTKQINAIITLNTTATSFTSDIGGVRTAFIKAVAAAAGVPISAVRIGTIKATTSNRRLLSSMFSDQFDRSIQVHTVVIGAAELNDVGFQLAKHDPSLHLGHTWEEAHTVRSTAGKRRPLLSARL
jgi:hypothetical protein